MFEITETSINKHRVDKLYSNPRIGGLVTFEGLVRNHNEGFNVSSLEYQAYEAMAVTEGNKVIAEAKELFDAVDIYCIHRTGHLQIGDCAVYVIASGEHRKECFDACMYVIDTVKTRVPIWKKEHYVDRPAVWVECHSCQEAARDHNHSKDCGHD